MRIIESPFTKRRADSIHECEIKICGNILATKPDDSIRMYFEIVNGLPT